MSITHNDLSSETRLSTNLHAAIDHVQAAAAALKSITTYHDPANGITDADWLEQIAELLMELNPATRGARCPECGSGQLIYCKEVNLHYPLIEANTM